MQAMRVLYTSSLAAGIGLAGVLGTGIASANTAAPPSSTAAGSQNGPDIKLDHHDRKEALKQDKKELKHDPQQVTPAASSRH